MATISPSRSNGWRGAGSLVTTGAALAAGALAWGALVERNLFTLREHIVPVLPAGAEPIRMLHLSDLHMAPWQRDKQAWIAALARLQPDLIVDTGDNLGHRDGLIGVAAGLEPFRGTPGVYVWGSNDYFAPKPRNPMKYFTGPSRLHGEATRLDIDALRRYFDDLGLTGLNNTAAAITVKGTRFEFFGVDDPHRGYDRLDLVAGAIDELEESFDEEWGFETRQGAPQPAGKGRRGAPRSPQNSVVRIGVAHAPYQRVLNDFVNHGAQLILAGHTHGGQICVPGFGALVTNCDIPRQQVKGLSMWQHARRSSYLNVSAGLGTSIYAPVRFACPPEASLLTLVPTAEASVA